MICPVKGNSGGNLCLSLTAIIWGSAFVAQSLGMSYVGPFTFNAIRSIIGGIILIPCIFLLDKIRDRQPSSTVPENPAQRKQLVIGGIACGIVLAAASSLQQIGIAYTSAGKAGFITALYIVLVPVFGAFFKRRVAWTVWIGVVLAVAGLYLLCINEEFRIGTGDIYLLFVRGFLCRTYSSDRPFLSVCRRRAYVLHPVFCRRTVMHDPYAPV